MSVAPTAGAAERWDGALATTATCLFGAGCVTGLAGAAAGDPVLGVGGGVAAAAGLTLLFAAGWLSPLAMVALSLPLPALYDGEALRLSPAAALTAVALFGWALARVVSVRPVQFGRLPRRSALALLGAVLLAAIFADARGPAARELVNFGLLIGLLVMATDLLAADRRRVHALASTLAAVAGIAGALAGIQATTGIAARFPLAGTSLHRASLGFGWPNELGVFFAVSLPLCWYAARAARTAPARAAAVAGLAAAGVGLLATFSRGSWLAVLVSAGILLLAGEARLTIRIAVGVVIGAALADLAAGGLITTRLWSLTTDPYVVQRAALMLVAVIMFRENLLVGVGPGGFLEHLEEYGPQVPWLWDYVGSAHNAYLEMAAETGIPGLAAFVAFLGAVLLVLLRGVRRLRGAPAGADPRDAALRRALLWSFGAACVAGFTVWPFAHGIGQLMMLVIAMGVVAAGETAR